MYIFVVQYTESERNSFAVLRLEDESQWDRFIVTKLPDHVCGYLVTDEHSLRDIPLLQRQKYHASVRPGEELDRKSAGESQFMRLLRETAVEFSDERLKAISQVTNKRRVSMAEAATKDKAPKAQRSQAVGERTRFTLDPQKKITIKAVENPRRKGSDTYEKFKLYKNGMTVEQALKAGLRMVDLKADIERGHIAVA